VAFGEQVESQDGREWLAGIRADLEDVGFACGAVDFCAAGVKAPHGRPRLYWVANSDRPGERRQHHPQIREARCGETEMGRPFWERFRVVTGRGVGWDRGEYRRGAPEPRALVLANGFPGRVAQVRAFGNAIVPQVAAEVIGAFLDVERAAA
jgi:DNA (cytosine-5)-methyltransferase 1